MNGKLTKAWKKIVVALFKKKKKDRFAHDQEGDWEKILISFTLIICLIVGVCIFFFYKLNQGDLFKGEMVTTQTQPMFHQNLLKQHNDYYDTREQTFESLKGSSSTVIDPSL